MSDLYNAISALCERHGITIYKMCKDIGIRGSVLSDLNTGRKKGLSAATLSKIADYFGVSIDEVARGCPKKEKPLVNGDEELTEYLEMLRTRPEMRMMFQLTSKATKEEVERAVKIVETLLEKENFR